MVLEEGNSASNAEDEPIEITERNLSDGFLQVATEIEQITEENATSGSTPNIFSRILACLSRTLAAFFK
jgi:hypothetical protein